MGSGALIGHKTRVVPSDAFSQIDLANHVTDSTSRPSDETARPNLPEYGGGCLFYLEQIRYAGGGHPYLKVRLERATQEMSLPGCFGTPEEEEEKDSPKSKPCVLRWPAKPCVEVASYYSAQSLRLPMQERRECTLHLEVWEQKMKLARISEPMGDLEAHTLIQRQIELQPSAKSLFKRNTPCPGPISISFQILDSRAVTHKRTVFFVRHAESVWNDAQSKKHYYSMVKETDHPLSIKGREQAEALSEKLQQLARGAEVDPRADAMLSPDAVWVSPLTRAVQTAVIGLGPLLTRPEGLSKMTLLANAREKKNMGGMDTCSTKTGISILECVVEKLRACYSESSDQARDHVLDTFAKLCFDVREVEGKWWCEGQVESKATFQARLEEFMAQLLYTPHRSIVVVGHSHFFRAFFARYLSEEFKKREPTFSQHMMEQKLSNCGVVRMELDPQRGPEGPIVDAEAIFGSWVS